MPVDQYMLGFNFAEIANQVAVVQGSYTDFGRALKSSTSDIITDFETLTDQIEIFQNAFTSVTSITDQQYLVFLNSMTQTAKLFENFAKDSAKVVDNFEKIEGFDLNALGKESPADRIAAIIPGGVDLPGMEAAGGSGGASAIAKEAKEAAEEAVAIAKKARDDVKATGEQAKKDAKGIAAYIQKEMKGARRSMRGVAGRAIPGGIVGGGLIGGLVALMVLGVSEEQRRDKEKGEMLNVFEAMGNVFSKQGQKMTEWFGGFQQQAQRYWGIAKERTQAVVKMMVDAGYKSSEIMGEAAKGVYEVNSNVATLSMGLDAYFGLASGASMSGMTELVVEYGDSLKGAASKYTDLMFAAQRSGMGVNKFIDAVRSGSQALTQYGIDVRDVAGALLTVKKHYKDLGMTPQAAGGWAAKGIGELAQGLSAVTDINIIAMRRQRPELDPFEAKHALQAGWLEKDKEGRYPAQVKAIAEFLEERASGDETVQKEILMQQGWSYMQASTLMILKDNIDNQGRFIGATKDQIKELGKAFETEGKSLSDLQKIQSGLIDKLYKLGLGLTQVVTGLVATIVTGFASLPMLVNALSLEGDKRWVALMKISNLNEKQLAHVMAGFSKTETAALDLGSFLGKNFADIFPNFEDLKKASDFINKSKPKKAFSWADWFVGGFADMLGFSDPQAFADAWMEQDRKIAELMNQAWASVGVKAGDTELSTVLAGGSVMQQTRMPGDSEPEQSVDPRPNLEAQQRLRGEEPQPPPPPPDTTASEPLQAPSPEASIWPGPGNVSSPKHTISAASIHNSLNQTQSRMPSETAR